MTEAAAMLHAISDACRRLCTIKVLPRHLCLCALQQQAVPGPGLAVYSAETRM